MTETSSNLREYSETELTGKRKALLSVLTILVILETLYIGYYAYLVATGQFDVDRHLLGLVPLVALTPIMVLVVVNLGKVSRELEIRGGN